MLHSLPFTCKCKRAHQTNKWKFHLCVPKSDIWQTKKINNHLCFSSLQSYNSIPTCKHSSWLRFGMFSLSNRTFTLSNCGTIEEVMSSNASVFKGQGGWGEWLFDATPIGASSQPATENRARVFREMSPGLYGSPTPTHKPHDQWWVLINHNNDTSPSTPLCLNLCPARDKRWHMCVRCYTWAYISVHSKKVK